MTQGGEESTNSVSAFGGTRRRSILDLPDDVVFILFSYFDLETLGRITQVCKHFQRLAEEEIVWLKIRRKMTIIEEPRHMQTHIHSCHESTKEKCRVANNWKKGHKKQVQKIHFRVKQIPWLQFDSINLWCSYKNVVRCFKQRQDGSLLEVPAKTLRGHHKDIVRFVAKDQLIISGARDGSICSHTWEGDLLMTMGHCHISDVQAVDFHGQSIISGSRDSTIKMWTMDSEQIEALQHTISVHDRIWSLAYNPDGKSFTSGTAGVNHVSPSVSPLKIWDAEKAQLLTALGSDYRHGAGILDIHYEDPHTLLSAGYDTIIRLWDTRMPCSRSILALEEPFDSAIFCVKSDGNNAILAGTARHGMTRLWDKRMPSSVQVYFSGKFSSPVYSLAFDPHHLYVALDRGIHMLDFT